MERKFSIIRKPDAIRSFLFNNVNVDYVGTCPETGISFYCSIRENYGVRVYPNGSKTLKCASPTTCANSKIQYDSIRKQRYLQFKNAFGTKKHILVSHAVWIAAGRTILPGMVMDHINGNPTNNSISNLRCITPEINARDGGFLRKLRNNGFNPEIMNREILLRYYMRMAIIKPMLSNRQYFRRLEYIDLFRILYRPPKDLSVYLNKRFNIDTSFQL